MLIQPANIKQLLTVRLNPGDEIYSALNEAIRREKINNAIILTGVGSVNAFHYHVVSTPEMPPENAFVKGEKAMDIVNINGMVLEGRLHSHIIFSDTKVALGGHMEPGCRVLTFAVVVFALLDGVDLTGWDGFEVMDN